MGCLWPSAARAGSAVRYGWASPPVACVGAWRGAVVCVRVAGRRRHVCLWRRTHDAGGLLDLRQHGRFRAFPRFSCIPIRPWSWRSPPSSLPPAPPESVAQALPRLARSRRAWVPAARCVRVRPALVWIARVVRVQRPLWRWWRGEDGAGVHWAAWADGVVCEGGGPTWVVLDVGCAGGGRGAIRLGIAPVACMGAC